MEKKTLLDHIHEAVKSGSIFKMTMSKPIKTTEFQNIYIRPIAIENTPWQVKYRTKTTDQVKNYNIEDLIDVIKEQELHFKQIDLFLTDKTITKLTSKKGKTTILSKPKRNTISPEAHNHQKKRLIQENVPYLQDLGITSSHGKVFAQSQNKFKQVNRYVELVAALIKDDKTLSKIYDMGSGKGYLTFALHDHITKKINPEASTIGVEIRSDLVQKCNAISQKNELKNLTFEQGSIDTYTIDNADMIIALHACDIATDMAIAKGLEAKAKYIVTAPCCHKQIRKAMQSTDTVLSPLLAHGILKERQAEMITDTIRALILQSMGYEVKVFEFIAMEHTGKNVMITAEKKWSPKPEYLQQVERLKGEFGIQEHYLEKLI